MGFGGARRLVPAMVLLAAYPVCGLDEARVSIHPRIAEPAGSQGVFRTESSLVLVPVAVSDARNRPVTGLRREMFRVFEGGTEQPVLHFSIEDAPRSLGVALDCRRTMAGSLRQSRDAAARFLRNANPQDEFFLVEFNDRSRVAVPFTGNPNDIVTRLDGVTARGQTALLDAVHLALSYVKKATNGRRALLV